ncbi:mCG144669, partial [Mus musculus]
VYFYQRIRHTSIWIPHKNHSWRYRGRLCAIALMLRDEDYLRQICRKGTWQIMFLNQMRRKVNDIEGCGPPRNDGDWLSRRKFMWQPWWELKEKIRHSWDLCVPSRRKMSCGF